MIKNVTVGPNLTTVVTPGPACNIIIITNNGTGAVNLSYDGVSVPTATVGEPLQPSSKLILAFPTNAVTAPQPITAFPQGSVNPSLSVSTNDTQSV